MNAPTATALDILQRHQHTIGIHEGEQGCSCRGWDWRQAGQPLTHFHHVAEELAAAGVLKSSEGEETP